MKKVLTILTALLTLGTLSSKAQTQTETTATCGETVVITATAAPGYEFDYWQDQPENHNPEREIVIDGTTALLDNYVAVFKAVDVPTNFTVNNADWGSITIEGTYTIGQELTLTAEPSSACYKFKQWSDGNTDATRTFKLGATAEANTLVAEFELVTFTIRASSQTGGKVTIASK